MGGDEGVAGVGGCRGKIKFGTNSGLENGADGARASPGEVYHALKYPACYSISPAVISSADTLSGVVYRLFLGVSIKVLNRLHRNLTHCQLSSTYKPGRL